MLCQGACLQRLNLACCDGSPVQNSWFIARQRLQSRTRRVSWIDEGLRKSCQLASQLLEVQLRASEVDFHNKTIRCAISKAQMYRGETVGSGRMWLNSSGSLPRSRSLSLPSHARERSCACRSGLGGKRATPARSSDCGSMKASLGYEGSYSGDEGLTERRDFEANLGQAPLPPYKAPNLWAQTWGRDVLPEEGLISERKRRKREAALGGSPCTFIRRTLRTEVERHEGTVVIFGDVLEDASISAGGDILVFGKLSGRVHAGMFGDRDAVVAALEMRPSQIRIADRSAGQAEDCQPYAELATIGPGGAIVIRPAGRLLSKVTSAEEIEDLRKRTSARRKKGSLSAPTRAAAFTGLYIFLVGLGALLLPRTFFGLLFSPGVVPPGWIRVMAVLAMVFGVTYLGTALTETYGSPHLKGVRAFYFSTVIARYMLFFLFGLLVAFGAVQPTLMVLGVINFVGALWMQIALQVSDS